MVLDEWEENPPTCNGTPGEGKYEFETGGGDTVSPPRVTDFRQPRKPKLEGFDESLLIGGGN